MSHSSTTPNPPPHDPRPSASLQKQQSITRRKSLRLPNQPQIVPIPPSLLKSPYLNSPQSIFQHELSSPHLPSQEDEQWLQDTIPLVPHISHGKAKESNLDDEGHSNRRTQSAGPWRIDDASADGRQFQPHYSPAPISPTLVYWNQMPSGYTTRRPWLAHTKSKSDTSVTIPKDQTYPPSISPMR